MLVLSRREGEAIQIGDDVWVTIVRIRGSAVRIGIEAPRSMKVLRDDLEGYAEPGEGDSSNPARTGDIT